MRKILILTWVGILSGCNQADDKVFADGGINEEKPLPVLLKQGAGTSEGDAIGLDSKGTPVAEITYSIEIETRSGAKPCKGEVELLLLSNFNLEVPTFEIQCLSMTVDLAGVLGAAGGGGIGGFGAAQEGNLQHDGMVLSLKNIAGAQFEPARPVIIGPIIQNPKKYKGYKKTSKHSVTAKDMVTGESLSGNGSLKVEVLEVGEKYDDDEFSDVFQDILHWQMTKKGFEGLNGSHGMLFDKIEFYWNMRPIMIPKIVIEGDMGAMIGGENGDSASDILGILTITLAVKDYELIDD